MPDYFKIKDKWFKTIKKPTGRRDLVSDDEVELYSYWVQEVTIDELMGVDYD